ncbi:MAG: ABC transporter permease [Chloroflexi bacterium]|nr:ABC transporter permease [Chloroflexota bacterium]
MNALAIARFTIQEAASRRLILAGVVLSLAFVGLFTLGFAFLNGKLAEANATRPNPQMVAAFGSIMAILGLYAVHFLASFLGLFLSVGAISGEIDSGTLHAVLARPIGRADFVVGRWLAYVGLMGVYVALMAGLLLLVARLIAGYEAPDPARAMVLMALGPILLLTLSLFGSTLLSTLANGVVVFTLFGLAWLAGIIEFVGDALSNEAMVNLGIVVSLLVPSDELWRGASYYVQSPAFLAAATAGRGAIPFAAIAPPSTPFVIWAVLHPLVFLLLAIVSFSRRDL